MKIISMSLIVDNSIKVIKRFPLLILIAFLGSIAFSMTVQMHPKDTSLELFNKIGLMCLIGVFISGALYLFTERKNFSTIKKHLFVGLITVPILILYFYNFSLATEDGIRLVFLIFTTILIITLSYPYGASTQNDFWHFNKVLFLRVLVSGLFTFALFLGLSLALLAVDKLFGVEISGKAYQHLFIWLIGIFSIFFFLAGVPADLGTFSGKKDYPKSLKIFTQYILIPIAFIYMVILYVYAITILFKWELPRGMVTSLTLTFSAIGILSVLFVFPLIESSSNRWMKLFRNWFYRLIFPLLFLMGFAIYQRVSDYGITIDRYLSIVATLWLFCMALYFTFSGKKNIKIIPVSLIIVGFLISFGPQSAFNISENSQLNRLNNYIAKYGLLKKENINKTVIVSEKDLYSIESIIEYLINFHKSEKLFVILHRRTNLAIDSVRKKGSYSAFKLMKLKNTEKKNDYYGFYDVQNESTCRPFSITDYDYFCVYEFFENSIPAYGELSTSEFYTKIDVKKPALYFILKTGSLDTLQINFSELVGIAKKKEKFNFEDIQSFSAENNVVKIKFIPISCGGNSKRIDQLKGYIFYSIKK
ncbi:MAG: DUF4153 domain-containing protein [bacterium]